MTSQPHLHQRSAEVQQFGTTIQRPIALSYDARAYKASCIADAIVHIDEGFQAK